MMDQITYVIHQLHYNVYLEYKFLLAIMNDCNENIGNSFISDAKIFGVKHCKQDSIFLHISVELLVFIYQTILYLHYSKLSFCRGSFGGAPPIWVAPPNRNSYL